MRLSNFRIPSAVIGLTLMSGVAVLFSEPITYAQSTQQVAFDPVPIMPSKIDPSAGSHKMTQMCGKYKYAYKKKDGSRVDGTTKVHCGSKYREDHHTKEDEKKSGREACDAAREELPKLEQGEEWLDRHCETYPKRG